MRARADAVGRAGVDLGLGLTIRLIRDPRSRTIIRGSFRA
jgi:hypothetical protein